MIHAALVWDAAGTARMLLWMRPSEYRGTDLVDPSIGVAGELKDIFQELVYGDFGFSGTLDASVRTRIKSDISLENTLLFDFTAPGALFDTGKLNPADLTEADFAANAFAFHDAGYSRGLRYNLFCAGHEALADGRIVVVGGHDKSGNHGIRKVNVFDPRTGQWAPRPTPQVMADFLADPTGSDPDHADARDEVNVDPPHASDMRYQRWYPTAVTLPDGRVLILSGTDQDSSAGPEQARFTKVRMAVPEVYDPATDRTIALESARKLLPMYPRSFVVQVGEGPDDWRVAVTAEVAPPLPTGDDLGGYDPFDYNGNTWLLDVRAALADPARDTPAENHWHYVTTAQFAHDSGASAMLVSLDGRGRARRQRIVLFGGESGTGPATAGVEMIDLADRHPAWEAQEPLVRPATQNNAVALPDGSVIVFGGRASGVNTLELQLFSPSSGQMRTVGTTMVPRHDHSTALLLPDGRVLSMGGNRVDIVPGNRDAGVPVAQIYEPPYLFKGDRPLITGAPQRIAYGGRFAVQASPDAMHAVLIRTAPVTHNWSWGNRYVRLTAEKTATGLSVAAPASGGLAPPGNYLLFVLSEEGVPSIARHVMVGPG